MVSFTNGSIRCEAIFQQKNERNVENVGGHYSLFRMYKTINGQFSQHVFYFYILFYFLRKKNVLRMFDFFQHFYFILTLNVSPRMDRLLMSKCILRFFPTPHFLLRINYDFIYDNCINIRDVNFARTRGLVGNSS